MDFDFASLSATTVMISGVAYFALLYLGGASLTLILTRLVLPRLGIGQVIDVRPVASGQLRRELGLSSLSILIFGAGLIVPWGLLQLEVARLADAPTASRIALEIAVLLVWNELHFYLSHRALHSPWLRRFHLQHHQSKVTTPFSTYSFHPVEAMMLGSVPLLPMVLHDFSFAALAALPVLSILLNNLGHSNYTIHRHPESGNRFSAGHRHHLHHVCYSGNYGFLFSVFDRWLGTALPPDAASTRLAGKRLG